MRQIKIAAFALLSILLCVPAKANDAKPNVVFVFADDMGYGEIEALNPKRSRIPTPNLNRLAAEGRVFTDAHSSSSVCTPTRYALLTGRYNWRTRLQRGVTTGNDQPLIAADRMTLAHLFRDQGYSTAVVGKWHLNYSYVVPDELKNKKPGTKTKTLLPTKFPIGTQIPDGPLTRGFDTYYGFHHARVMSSIVRDTEIVDEKQVDEVLPALTQEVVRLIDKKSNDAKNGEPFFIYFPLSSPHTPIAPAKDWKGKTKLGDYGDFVAQTDGSVGAVMDALDRNELTENTIVIFSTDNGTSRAANIAALQKQGHFPSAHLRGSKADLWDGGHRVPFIVRWPNRIKASSQSSQLVCQSDMMATFAEYFSVQLPADAGEDSFSFLPALFGKPIAHPRTSIVHHSSSGRFSIRDGHWKLLLAPGSGGWSAPNDRAATKAGLPEMQLYNLQKDIGETNNLVNEYPEKVQALVEQLETHVANGRTTPGPIQKNDTAIDIWKKALNQPAKKKKGKAKPKQNQAKKKNQNKQQSQPTKTNTNEITPNRKVTYKRVGEVELKLHIFEPAGHSNKKSAPAIVFFFGGGWTSGSPRQFYEQSQFLAEQGVVAIASEYRIKNQHGTTPFDCVRDGKSAIRFVREHASEMGINPDKIVAAGGSAGGHVAACTGVIQGFEEAGEDQSISSVPNAMILFNPVLDTTKKGFGLARVGKDRQTEISPCHHVRAGIPPTLLFHGTGDKTVPFENAERFARLMKELGNPCQLVDFKDRGHGFFNGPFFRKGLKDDSDYRKTMSDSMAFLTSLGFIADQRQQYKPSEDNVKRQFTKPNIILIYTDDQGYGDVSALNPHAKFQTPNMDRLAKEGIAFTNGHSADSVCTPSRYALLTGRYPWRTKMKRGVLGAEAPCLIADGRMTIASLLNANGYDTAMVGKWHLGMDFPGSRGDRDWSQPIQDMPLDKGFDYYFGIPASLNFGVLAWFEGRMAAVPPTQFTNKKKNQRHIDYRIMPPYHETPEQTQKELNRPGFEIAPDFIDNECLTRFTDKAIDWMQSKTKSAENDRPFFLYLPFTSPHYPVCPLPQFHGQGECGAYGEFVIETDFHVGRILDFLNESGLDQNTLIIFTSDNGPEKSWQERIKQFDHDSRGGLRGGKRSVYEGGHRVPFLVRWPAGIRSPGRTTNSLVGQIDLLATIADLIGSQLPDNAGEDSQSFLSILLDENSNHQRLPLINHGRAKQHRYAITEGDWKLLVGDATRPAELYNLSEDRAEKKNIAADHTERVQQMTQKINHIIANGRTTPGKPQPNATGYWKHLTWLTESEYQSLVPIGR